MKKLVNLTADQAEAISTYRHEERIASENEAIRGLIEEALAQPGNLDFLRMFAEGDLRLRQFWPIPRGSLRREVIRIVDQDGKIRPVLTGAGRPWPIVELSRTRFDELVRAGCIEREFDMEEEQATQWRLSEFGLALGQQLAKRTKGP